VSIPCKTHRCSLGKCLHRSQICDSKKDCHDGSDERKQICEDSSKKPCSPQEFRCKNEKCIEKIKFCNHINDCGDKSDEPSECTCFSYLKSTSPEKICDGVMHCWDRSDESIAYCGADCSRESSFTCGL
jgi:Low-density lipoprotein receptor domain class A